ncbi:MAG: hypothetical protein AB203_02595 [Parcubacteria bacterium C7867-008]|nr:MAG: hypothetical protein AB203_02595 [Parcubacteria bacterium C7867-008]
MIFGLLVLANQQSRATPAEIAIFAGSYGLIFASLLGLDWFFKKMDKLT